MNFKTKLPKYFYQNKTKNMVGGNTGLTKSLFCSTPGNNFAF